MLGWDNIDLAFVFARFSGALRQTEPSQSNMLLTGDRCFGPVKVSLGVNVPVLV